MSIVSENARKIARQIANRLDFLDGKDNRINASTWKKYAVVNFGAKDNVSVFINVSDAEFSIAKCLTENVEKTGENINTIGEKWKETLIEDNKIQEVQQVSPKQAANKSDKKQEAIDKTQKNKIVTNMYTKWSSRYKNSNLDINFYSKLYDFIKTINCEANDNISANEYAFKIEQTMDEVIAVIAGESSLNSKAKNSIYRGIFQLDSASLSTVKKVAKEYNIKGVNQNITIAKFANLSGEQQLPYLMAHIMYGRERSGLTKNEKISPEQLWAMIKSSKSGQKDSLLVKKKSKEIVKIFKSNNIERG